jgi:alpha-ribazole phosphatase/probable phosphoglycerate mutase
MVRHGEIPSNVKNIYAGTSAEKLTPRGLLQAEDAADKLKAYDLLAIYSSPVERALQTADIIRSKTGLHVHVHNAFREMELGPWQGMSETEVAQRYPEEWKIWNSCPAELDIQGRETLNQLLERVLTGIITIYREHHNILVVTHVAIIRVLLLWSENESLNMYKSIHVPNAEILTIKIDSCPVL